ncbi:hypothetical protein [Actinokineospora inagensis]|uniref:hypothetical protein n=1 Tax=Actinokineospora inagensis TaxID=103730 RepID=UPI00041F28D2|nr:hypothetical protein [Actinokineospora inagensis]
MTINSNHDVNAPSNINSGTGPQHNHFYAPQRRRREPRFFSTEEIRRLAGRFVVPPGFPADAFTRSSTILITGPNGAGKVTAALMLLTDRGSADVALRVLDDQAPDPDDPVLDANELRQDDRLLLNLCDVPESRVRELRPELEAYLAAVARAQARLVVVAGIRQLPWLPDSLVAQQRQIQRPDGTDVLREHLAAEGIRLPTTLSQLERLSDYLTGSPYDIAELARTTVQARDHGDGDDPVAWLRSALAARLDRADQAANLFINHQEAGTRVLMATAAFLSGAPLDALVAAEAMFGRMVKLPRDDQHAMAGAHLAERMGEVGLHADGRRTVAFTQLEMDSALRTHFWTYFPDLRPTVELWVREVTGASVLPGETADNLLTRYADLLLTTGNGLRLTKLAEHWSTTPKRREHPELAARALRIGLRDPEWSGRFREFVYDRSRARDLKSEFAKVLITACEQDIAPNRPPQALVRLHHFTRHSDPDVRALAHDTLIRAVHRYGFQRWLLYRLCRSENLSDTDRAIVLDLQIPPAMAGEYHTRRNLLTLWQQIFRDTTRTDRPDLLWEWLGRDPELVIEACGGRANLLNELYLLARDQVRHAVDRRSAVARANTVLRHVDAALGIDDYTNERGQG